MIELNINKIINPSKDILKFNVINDIVKPVLYGVFMLIEGMDQSNTLTEK
jgi:hypothetical protein